MQRLMGCGMSRDAVARAMDMSELTLIKHYDNELKNGKAKARSEAISFLWTSAQRGNVAAQRKLIALTGGDPEVEAKKRTRRGAKLGKKDQAQRDAEKVTGMYAPPDVPRLIVDNSK